MSDNYDYWLDLNGNEKQNKKTRYNKIMKKIDSDEDSDKKRTEEYIKDILKKSAFDDGLGNKIHIVAPPSIVKSLNTDVPITFRVYDEFFEPIKNRKISIYDESTIHDAETDEKGECNWTYKRLIAGHHFLTIRVYTKDGNVGDNGALIHLYGM